MPGLTFQFEYNACWSCLCCADGAHTKLCICPSKCGKINISRIIILCHQGLSYSSKVYFPFLFTLGPKLKKQIDLHSGDFFHIKQNCIDPIEKKKMRRLKEIVYFHFQASYISSSFTFNFLLQDESNKTEKECSTC